MTTPPEDRAPAAEKLPATRWAAVRWDVAVFLLAAAAFLLNYVRPDQLSSTMMLAFALAMAWVAYRIYLKLQAFRKRN